MRLIKGVKRFFNRANDSDKDFEYHTNSMHSIRTPGRNNIIYKGESESALIAKMKKRGEIDISNKDESLFIGNNALGTIFIGLEKKHSWLAKRKSFMGWQIIITDMPTKLISFK